MNGIILAGARGPSRREPTPHACEPRAVTHGRYDSLGRWADPRTRDPDLVANDFASDVG
jgi:hypothetical protein